MATELTIKVPNRAGQLAAITTALGDAQVNIAALAGSAVGSKGVIHVVVADKDAARARRHRVVRGCRQPPRRRHDHGTRCRVVAHGGGNDSRG